MRYDDVFLYFSAPYLRYILAMLDIWRTLWIGVHDHDDDLMKQHERDGEIGLELGSGGPEANRGLYTLFFFFYAHLRFSWVFQLFLFVKAFYI